MAMYCHPHSGQGCGRSAPSFLASEAAVAVKGALVAVAAAPPRRQPQLRLAVNGKPLLGAPAGGQPGSGGGVWVGWLAGVGR